MPRGERPHLRIVPGAWLNQVVFGSPKCRKARHSYRLLSVRANQRGERAVQREREAKAYWDSLTPEQEVWALREIGFSGERTARSDSSGRFTPSRRTIGIEPAYPSVRPTRSRMTDARIRLWSPEPHGRHDEHERRSWAGSARGAPGTRGMRWVAGGSFVMGSEDFYPEEGPTCRRGVAGFWIDEHSTTTAEFARFVEATGYTTMAERQPEAADYPDADPALLVPGSAVFRKTAGPVDLNDYHSWWEYLPGASWRWPAGRNATPGRAYPPGRSCRLRGRECLRRLVRQGASD